MRFPGGQTLRKDAQVRLATNSLVDLLIGKYAQNEHLNGSSNFPGNYYI